MARDTPNDSIGDRGVHEMLMPRASDRCRGCEAPTPERRPRCGTRCTGENDCANA